MTDLLQVYGFPRSGGHFLCRLLADNFYPGVDLFTPLGYVGHWADRVHPTEFPRDSLHGKVIGHHGPPEGYPPEPRPYRPGRSLYIFRDGRAVAASLWRSPHFKHPRWKDATFSEFIRAPLDWAWHPGRQAILSHNVIQHWRDHLERWAAINVYFVQYEVLCRFPKEVLIGIAEYFGLVPPDGWTVSQEPAGFFPSGGRLDGWRDLWSDDDTAWFHSQVPRWFYGVWRV